MALITLTSDIGRQDYLLAAVKGLLLRMNPDFQLVDISHDLIPFNHPQAAYICRNAIRHFPPFSFHLVLVNLFDQKQQQFLLAFHQDQYILCADNGLLTMILEDKPEMVIGLQADRPGKLNTLECVELMAKAVQKIQEGASLQQIGTPDIPYIEKKALKPYLEENWMEGRIIHIDHFENVIVNITRQEFEEHRRGRSFRIVFKREEVINKISDTYADVSEGEKLALFNSAGYLEIAVNKGKAAGLFGLVGFSDKSNGAQNKLIYQTVRVFFE